MADTKTKTVWLIDPVHSRLSFSANYLLLSSVSGWFSKFEGSVVSSGKDFEESEVQLTIYTSSIFTGNEERDAHLRSPDFFDAMQYPVITFKSTGVSVKDGGFIVEGDLTIKQVTKPLRLEVAFNGIANDPLGNIKAGFHLDTLLNRTDFDITWNKIWDSTKIMLGDKVSVTCDIQLLKV